MDLRTNKDMEKKKARTPVESVDVHRGIEALRAIRSNLFRKDAKRLKEQFDALTHLDPIKTSAMRLFTALLTAWEDELNRFARLDADYTLGKHQRRQILYAALHSEPRKPLTERKRAGD